MKRIKGRITNFITAFTTAFTLLSLKAYAWDVGNATGNAEAPKMWAKFNTWYQFFTKEVAPIALIVNIALLGISFLGTGFLSRPEMTLNRLKKTLLYCCIALLALCLLPYIVEYIISLVKSTAWSPT